MTAFSLTLDSFYGSLVLVAAEQLITDVTEIRIAKSSDGKGFDCEMTRSGGGTPVKLVAACSAIGKELLRANGKESVSAPGFVEVSPSNLASTKSSVTDDIAEFLGQRRA